MSDSRRWKTSLPEVIIDEAAAAEIGFHDDSRVPLIGKHDVEVRAVREGAVIGVRSGTGSDPD
jgi:hypothetical protein